MNGSDPEQFSPPGVDLEHPSVARVYDYYLEGTANWAIDREFGDKILEMFPLVRPIAKANRVFLHRAIRHLVRLGIRQFIDIGSGIPTMGSTHTVADEVAPGAVKVVYVDNEPVAVAHSQVLIEEHGDPDRHAVIHADLRDPDGLWQRAADSGKIDITRPIGLLMVAVLHVQQRDTAGTDLGPTVVARYRDLLPHGSYLVISHATDDGVPEELKNNLAKLKKMYDAHSSSVKWRTRAEVADLFGDFDLVEPGVTWTPLWHPDETGPSSPDSIFDTPNQSVVLAGVGRKP